MLRMELFKKDQLLIVTVVFVNLIFAWVEESKEQLAVQVSLHSMLIRLSLWAAS